MCARDGLRSVSVSPPLSAMLVFRDLLHRCRPVQGPRLWPQSLTRRPARQIRPLRPRRAQVSPPPSFCRVVHPSSVTLGAVFEDARLDAVVEPARGSAVVELALLSAVVELARVNAVVELVCLSAVAELTRLIAVFELVLVSSVRRPCAC